MIRSAFLRPAFTAIKNDASKRTTSSLMLLHSSAKPFRCTISPQFTTLQLGQRLGLTTNKHSLAIRASSSSSSTSGESTEKQTTSSNEQQQSNEQQEQPTSQEIVLTPGEKVVVGTRLFFWATALTFASICAYYIGKELLPTKMSPNTVFDRATNLLRSNSEINARFGPFKTYGRDHGGHREGRRNFIEHTEYTDENDGSKRTRVRFNLEGQYGQAFVFAEVSKEMESGEFVYVLVQDKRNGQVISVVDNRSVLLAKRLGGGSKEGSDVFANLLGGGKK